MLSGPMANATTDQGVMGGILTMEQFLTAFPGINPDEDGISAVVKSERSTDQGISVASYNLGCFLGAIISLV